MHHPPFPAAPRGTAFAARLLCACLAACAAFAALPSTALAQPAPAAARSYAIPAGPLGPALNRLGRESGTLITFAPELVAGEQTRGASGSLSVRQALDALLAGTGLSAAAGPQGAYVLQRTSEVTRETASGTPLSEVLVKAAAERHGTTEGTESYTTRSTSTATRLDLSSRETPQSVTVVTRQRMDDQGLQDINEVVKATPGLVLTGYAERQSYYARGFAIDSLTYDGLNGGAPSSAFSTDMVLADMAIYDRVEVVRGAAGLTQGAGTPSAAVNLVRKRPTRENQVSVTASAGNWNRYRAELDAAGPLNAAGTLRGRVVAAHQDHKSFQEVVDKKRSLLYGIVEADVGRDTRLTLGAMVQKEDNHASWGGLPVAWDGGDLGLPRSTYLGNRWDFWNKESKSAFAELGHRFDNGWSLQLSANGLWSDLDFLASSLAMPRAGVYDQTAGHYIYREVSRSLEAHAKGPFQWLGREHEAMVGASYRHGRFDGVGGYAATAQGMDIFRWDHDAVARPEIDLDWYFSRDREKSRSAYAATRLHVADPLRLIVGARLDWYEHQGDELWDGPAAYKVSRHFTKYAGLVYDLGNSHSAYASYTDIFKPQNARDVHDALLKPIIGRNYEIGIKGEYFNRTLNASLALFRIDQENRAKSLDDQTQCPGYNVFVTCYEAAGMVRSTGVELDLNGALTPNWQIGAGYSRAKAVYKEDSVASNVGLPFATHVPVQTFKLMTSYRLPGRLSAWRIGGSAYWQSAIFNTGTNFADRSTYRIEQEPYAVLDLMVSWQATRNLSILLNVGNVFDRRYYKGISARPSNFPTSAYGAPRNAMLTAKYQF